MWFEWVWFKYRGCGLNGCSLSIEGRCGLNGCGLSIEGRCGLVTRHTQ